MHSTRTNIKASATGLSLAILTVLSLPVAGQESTPATTMPARELGPALTESLPDIRPIDFTPGSALLQTISAKLGDSMAQIADTHVFTATETLDDNSTRSLVLAMLPIGRSDAEGYVAVGVSDDGVVRKLELWKRDDFDADPDGSWSYFCSQFIGRCGVVNAIDTLSASEIDQLAQDWADGKGDAPVRALQEQRLRMRENSYRFTYRGIAADRGEVPDAQWFRDWATNMQGLADLSDDLSGVYGDDVAAAYMESAERGRGFLENAADYRATDDMEGLRQAARPLYQQSCQACHRQSSPGLGEDNIYRQTQASFEQLGVRSDLLRVGLDVWSQVGQEAKSQQAADAIRAALMVLHAQAGS